MSTTITTPVTDVVDRIENAGPLDPAVNAVRKAVSTALKPRALRDALHGVWLGHPLHPMLTDVPIGMWSATAVLDAVPGTRGASSTLVAAGCATFVPTALAGWADWSQLHPKQQRVGLIHASANAVALSLYAGSLSARMRGHSWRGKLLGYAGFGALLAGGYLGGHLSFRQAAGANHNAEAIDTFPAGWQALGSLDDIPDGRPTKRTVGGVDLLVLRRGGHLDVIGNKCSHLSGPLADGEFTAEAGQGCIVCPWHGSTFRLSDGGVVHGPATAPQPRFETRVAGSMVEVRIPG